MPASFVTSVNSIGPEGRASGVGVGLGVAPGEAVAESACSCGATVAFVVGSSLQPTTKDKAMKMKAGTMKRQRIFRNSLLLTAFGLSLG
jgi:hypothetical protein